MKHDDSSSLELLLDAMCNTFGGVMFIAITLAVVLFSRNALENTKNESERHQERYDDVLRRIDELKAKLNELAQRSEEMTRTTKMMEADPRLKNLRLIAVMESQINSEAIRRTILDKESICVENKLNHLKKEQKVLEKELNEQKDAIGKNQPKVEKKEKILETLAQELKDTSPVTLAFTTLETHNDRPSYFILLKKGQFWRVGPGTLSSEDGIPKPLDDVTYTLNGNRVFCFPKENAGRDAMSGSQLSQECLQMLSDIPKDRGALFCFGKEDADLFYKMREEMKRLGIFHGFSINGDGSTFTYLVTTNTHYEY